MRQTFPKEWYSKIYEHLGIKDFKSQYFRDVAQRCRFFFCSKFTPEEVIKCLPYLEKNPRLWKSNLKPILAIVLNDEIKASYKVKTVDTGFNKISDLLTDRFTSG